MSLRLLRFFRLSALQNREFYGCFPKKWGFLIFRVYYVHGKDPYYVFYLYLDREKSVKNSKETAADSHGQAAGDAGRVFIPETVDIRTIRMKMGLAQSAFAERYGLSLYTLRNWEQGKRRPDPAARAYLTIIEKAPDIVLKLLKR
jgi:putative transcriptional regulator